ncbi:M13 family metallopeptidase [Apilactobacillus sp. TMW 2.2459]|uniref:M13-type metalloendopeptidase n=1 Tax=Apilactobacillus xinyiensis TaxID=2841032 RepID=UPI00200F7B10|nr:M13 family metallopeptidase [Apilactobacillus xinyiensis]MCL0312200.1 M13 family metallopeptidase [Apilactobacillus xinyiensis]
MRLRFQKEKFKLVKFVGLMIMSLIISVNLNTFYKKNFTALASTKETSSNSPSNDFYKYINNKWLNKVTIPKDKTSIGSIDQLDNKNEKFLRKSIKNLVKSNNNHLSFSEKNMVEYYRQASDKEALDKLGYKPIKPYLNKINAIKNKKEYLNAIKKWNKNGESIQAMPFLFQITADVYNSKRKVVSLYSPSTILPDKSLYYNNNPEGKKILQAYSQAAMELMTKVGISNNDANQKLKNALNLDAKIAKYSLSSEDTMNLSNVKMVSSKTINKDTDSEINISQMVNDIFPKNINTFSISNQSFFKNYNKIFDLNNIDEIKDWTYLSTLMQNANALSSDFRKIINDYNNKVYGTSSSHKLSNDAFNYTNMIFGPVLGKVYVKNNFNKETNQKVKYMIKNIIRTYKNELSTNKWLDKKTKNNAIKKLDNMVIKIGYPQKIDNVYSKINVSKNKNFFENSANINKTVRAENIKLFYKKSNRHAWEISPQTVNAFYNPSSNSITIPAGILQSPFFSLKNTNSENYGAIGVVIGHEISHAFDTNGSQFDYQENRKNWWTEKDYKEFNKRTNKIVERFNGLKFMSGKVNGKLTVTENTADLEGLRAAIKTAKKEPGFNSKQFFRSYATLWRSKTKTQEAQMQLLSDPHAPDVWRVNAQLPNINEFYDAYNIKKGSPMWVNKNQRLKIW